MAWLAIVLWMIGQYPEVDRRLLGLSSIYPVLYVVLSLYLDLQSRRSKK
jgi:hypothetical protein